MVGVGEGVSVNVGIGEGVCDRIMAGAGVLVAGKDVNDG